MDRGGEYLHKGCVVDIFCRPGNSNNLKARFFKKNNHFWDYVDLVI